jgi:hypothetical protein
VPHPLHWLGGVFQERGDINDDHHSPKLR